MLYVQWRTVGEGGVRCLTPPTNLLKHQEELILVVKCYIYSYIFFFYLVNYIITFKLTLCLKFQYEKNNCIKMFLLYSR